MEYHVAQSYEQLCNHTSILHSSSSCILCAPGWHRNAEKKQKYWHVQTPGRLTNTQADNICLSMTSSVCSVTPGVTAGYLHTKVSERLTRSDVTRSELHRNANKDSKKHAWDGNLRLCLPEWQFYPELIFFFFIASLCTLSFFPSSFCFQEDV